MENRIYNIFKSLIESGTKYVTSITPISDLIKISYTVNKNYIGFYFDDNNLDKHSLYINSKYYKLPEIISRSEKAHILDTLDNTIKEWEDQQLKSIESVLITDVEDNLD